jgi:hypothetical protein
MRIVIIAITGGINLLIVLGTLINYCVKRSMMKRDPAYQQGNTQSSAANGYFGNSYGNGLSGNGYNGRRR